jgi:hypothetical protein
MRQKSLTAAHVHPFPVRHAGNEINSVFTQEGQFTRDADGRIVAPFSCFPPFRGESPFVVARGRMVLTEEAVRELESLPDGIDAEARLVDAIKKKLPVADGGQLIIEPDDLRAGTPVVRTSPMPTWPVAAARKGN